VRLLEAADAERRRIERDIHDGAQQRLVSLALALRHAESRLAMKADPEVVETLRLASKEAHEALHELRDLARGIHPAVLTDQGLGAALRALATRSPLGVRVAVDLPPDRLPPKVEAAAYFVAAEALANAAKYAAASDVSLSARLEDEAVVITVTDHGAGGATTTRGSGLRGLADRVHALDGDFVVRSEEGKGTSVIASIPCV
jgi:signal transduction histidine kinase